MTALDVAPQANAPAFSRQAIIALIVAGLFSFSALAVLGSFAPDLRTGGDPRAHALSKSAVGYGGLVKLLQLEGQSVLIARTRAAPANPEALRVLTPDASVRPAELSRLIEGPTLMILPKWHLSTDRRSPDWVTRAGLNDAADLLKNPLSILDKPVLERRKDQTLVTLKWADDDTVVGQVPIANLQTVKAANLESVIVDEAGHVVLGARADEQGRNIYVLAEPDLLNTFALRDLNGAMVARAVLDGARPGPGPIFFDVTLNGYERGRNLWKLAFEPPFLAATLCTLVAGLLMGLQAAVRFGPHRREQRAIGLGKRALADNQAGLIRMAKREARMAEPYLKLIRDRTARIVGAGQVADEGRLERLLDRLGARRTQLSISELATEARGVSDPAGLMKLARRLHQWKLEISRERQ